MGPDWGILERPYFRLVRAKAFCRVILSLASRDFEDGFCTLTVIHMTLWDNLSSCYRVICEVGSLSALQQTHILNER